jgi:hypothetical protein
VQSARTLLTWTSLALVALLTPVALVAAWVEGTVTETDRYVATVAPLATDAEVQEAVERRLTERVLAAVEDRRFLERAAAALERQGVPPALAQALTLLADPVQDRLETAVGRVVRRLVEGEGFADAWAASNEVAHEQLMDVLSGQSELVEDGTTVSIRVATLTDALRRELVAAGVPGAERLPQVEAAFPIARVEDLERAQTAYVWLDRLGSWLPWVVLGLLLVAVVSARDRRRGLARAAVAVVGGSVVLVVLLAVGRQLLLGALPPDASQAVATSVLDTVTATLRSSVRWTALAALAVLVTAVLVGPSPAAQSLRAGAARAWAWSGAVADERPSVRVAAALVAVVGAVTLVVAGDLGVVATLVVAAVTALSTVVTVRRG